MLLAVMAACGSTTAPGKARRKPSSWPAPPPARMPRCKGNCWGAAPALAGGKTCASCPHRIPQSLAVSDKNSHLPPRCACRQAAACTIWAAGLSFLVYRVASILASSCSQEVLLVETSAFYSACASQPPGLVGTHCSYPMLLSGCGHVQPRSPQIGH